MAYTLIFTKKLIYTINISVKTSPPHPRCTKCRCPLKRKDADSQYRLFILYEDLATRVSILKKMFRLSPTIQVDEAAFTKAITGCILALKHYIGVKHFRPPKIKGKWVCPVEDYNRNYQHLDLYYKHIKTLEGFRYKILKCYLD